MSHCVMKSIQFFFKEHGYNILGSVSTKNAIEYLEVDGGYQRLQTAQSPFVLKVYGIHQIGVDLELPSKTMQFVMPVLIIDGKYQAMEFDEYYDRRSFNRKTSYIKISEKDRLKLHSSAKKNRNLRYDIFEYHTMELYFKRDLYLRPTNEKKHQQLLEKMALEASK